MAYIPKDKYICPICESKTPKKSRRKTKVNKMIDSEEGVIRNVLIRNRKKFQTQR